MHCHLHVSGLHDAEQWVAAEADSSTAWTLHQTHPSMLCRNNVAPDSRLFASLAHLTMDSGRLDAVLHVADLVNASPLPLDTVRAAVPALSQH